MKGLWCVVDLRGGPYSPSWRSSWHFLLRRLHSWDCRTPSPVFRVQSDIELDTAKNWAAKGNEIWKINWKACMIWYWGCFTRSVHSNSNDDLSGWFREQTCTTLRGFSPLLLLSVFLQRKFCNGTNRTSNVGYCEILQFKLLFQTPIFSYITTS